ncbi:MAG: HAMP domain-containing histidine kinase [bacterium]|nr:HAMP domain-containing histidine kinase [bacterium]
MKPDFKPRHKEYKRKYRSIFVKLMLIMLLMAFMVHVFNYILIKHIFTDPHSYSGTYIHIILQLSMATFAFIGAFLFILHVLAPIKQLRKAVNQISDGNLDIEVSVDREDELGELANAFNGMTKRIREMIKNRDQLLIDVSHELRSPITRIKLALEFIDDNPKKDGIRGDLNEIETMITEILETERMKNGHDKPNLNHHNIIDLIKETTRNYKERSPGIQLSQDSQNIPIKIDAGRIKIVLQNVLQNALKYSREDSQPVLISVEQAEQFVKVHIKDDGMGVPAEEIPHLFEPFYRVDRSRSKKTGGYGLGLSMCKRIMETHNGNIEAINNTNRGITITLTFPKEP